MDQRTALPKDLRLPVCAAPMFLVSGPDYVIQACKAGIVGAFPTLNCRTLETLDDWMNQIVTGVREDAPAGGRKAAPWLANVVTHSTNSRLPEELEMISRYRPPLVSTALGHPGPAIEVVRDYGGLVFCDVADLRLARKAIAAGADGLICIAAGAGGHTGRLSPFAFLCEVRRFFDGPLILAGGIADGRGVAAGIVAGADLVCLGTRFIATSESIAHQEHKRLVLDGSIGDITVSAGLTGTPVSWLSTSLRNAGYDPDNMPDAPKRHYDAGGPAKKRWKEIFSAGQGVGGIQRPEALSEAVDQLEHEFNQAMNRTRWRMPADTMQKLHA